MMIIQRLGLQAMTILLLLAAGAERLPAQQLIWEHWYPEFNHGDSLPFDIHTTGVRDPFYSGLSVMENEQGKYFVSATLGVGGGGFVGLNHDGTRRWEKRVPCPTMHDVACNPRYSYPESDSAVTFVSVRPYRLLNENSNMYTVTIADDGAVLREMSDTSDVSKYACVSGTYRNGYTIAQTMYLYTFDADTIHLDEGIIFRKDSTGHNQWKYYFTKPQPSLVSKPASLDQTPDGDYIIFSRITDGANTYDAELIRTDSLGNLRWRKTIPAHGLNYAFPERAIATKDNGTLVLSHLWRRSFTVGDSAYLIPTLKKYAADGSLTWEREYRKYQYDWPSNLLERQDGGVVIMGTLTLNSGTDSADDNFHVIGTDAGGNQLWDFSYGSPGPDRLNAGIVARDGNLVVTGTRANPYRLKDSTINAKDLYIAKLQLPVSSVGSDPATGASILANYPNPFKTTTTIPYILPVAGRVRVTVCDVLGNTITTLTDERQEPGIHTVRFDGQRLSAGTYFCRVETGGKVFTRAVTKLE